MFKTFMRIVSTLLILTLVIQMAPLQVWGQEYRDSLSADASTEITQTETIKAADTYIVAELTDKRTEYSKEFILSNGLHLAMVYPDAVHYEKDNAWAEIDNTLVAKTDGTYQNTAGVWNVQFPQQLSGSKSVVIQKDGYTLSFAMAGELRSTGLELAGTVDTPALQSITEITVPESTAETITDTVPETTAVAETTDSAIMEEIDHAETLAVSGMQLSNATVTPVDTSAMRESAQFPEAVPEKSLSRLSYNDVFTDTNIIYDLQANTVKESIVLERYSSTLRGYRYTLNVGQLIPVLLEDGQIDFYDAEQENIVMSMPAPFLVDASGEHSFDVQVTLVNQGDTYILTYLLPQGWLAEKSRAWPVVLDPVVSATLSTSNIRDITVSENTTYSHIWGMNSTGYHNTAGITRCYIKYRDLPTLTSSDVVLSARIAMEKPATSAASASVEIHKVNATWESETMTWANKPGFDPIIEDYAIVQNAGYYTWNITDIVREWYAGANTGMMLKVADTVEAAATENIKQFYSSDWGGTTMKPTLEIFFRNNNGLESYWDYTASSAGRAGTGYVNKYTGNLVWTRDDIGFGGNRMPVTISHVYNANDSTVPTDDTNTNDTGANYFGLGNGWRTNFHQRVYQYSLDSTYYVWEDGDGTDHYFKYKSANTYEDEDGLELTLTTGGSGNSTYKIKDKNGNTSYFDASGRLVKLENNQATKSSINITYTTTTGPLISTVTDGAGRKYYFTYPNGLLSRISYKGSAGTTEISYVTFTYSGTNLTRVTDKDGKHSDYTYTGNILTSAADVDGYKLAYTYNTPAAFQPYRVQSITESHNGITGGRLTIEYAHNQTKFTDHNQNVEIVQFNDMGNTISIQDGEGRAQFAQYALNSAEEVEKNTDSKKAANQLSVSSKLQNTVANMLRSSVFETDSCFNFWNTNRAGATLSRSSAANAYMGDSSLQVTFDTAGTDVYTLGPTFQAQPGKTYTLSAYIKTVGVAVSMGITNTSTWGTSTGSRITANTDWHRVQMTFTNSTDAAISYRPSFRGSELGTFYIDCVQVEEAPTASRANILENGEFRFGTSTWYNTGFTTTTVTTTATPQLDTTVAAVTGDPTAQKNLKQYAFVNGNAGDTYVVGAWAKGDSAPLTGDRRFGIHVAVAHTDGTYGHYDVSFNPDADNVWQYVSMPVITEKAYSQLSVSLVYDYNVNTAYFDGVQLYKEEFGSSYTYDDKGNVISVTDLQGQETKYEYSNNDLTKIIQNNKAKMTYTYDSYHNVKTAKTEENLTYSFEYDTYGNNTKVSITGSDGTISSSAAYTNSGNTLASTTDALENVTTYSYNTDTNVLEWVKCAKDTNATRTIYTYDEVYRLAKASSSTDTGLMLSAEYFYTDDYLTAIQTPTSTYNFTYGNFGVRESVSVGNRTLATYEYTDDGNNYLKKLAYGNQDSVSYEYDKLGRLTLQTYEDDDIVKYAYDNNGDLAQVYDSGSGITTKYYYDLIGRAMKYTETKSGYNHSVEYTYDTKNNLSAQTEIINGTTHNTTYTYDKDNRVTSKVTDNIGVYYTYDSFGRLTQQVTKNNGTVVLTETYIYNAGSAQIASHSTVGTNYSVTYEYTYDANGNILTVSDGTRTTSYVYDSANQVVRENNQAGNYTYTWTYDNAGNIQSKKVYDYTTGNLPETPTDTVAYGYTDEQWKDLLTSYDGSDIEYDNIGNPDGYGDKTFEWEHGRELASLTKGSETWTFTYDSNGMRTKRECTNGYYYEYIYDGSQLVQANTHGGTLYFTYDASGKPLTLTHNNTSYTYVTNAQGDVVGLLNSNGEQVVTYTYDAWGNRSGSASDPIVMYNPLCYRGYVYDQEVGLYYLQSRYYDPEIGRFINADSLVSTGQGFMGNNMFSYCLNNPVNFIDNSGKHSAALDLWTGFMWWLCFVDLALPVGDIIYLAGIGLTSVLIMCTNTGSSAFDTDENALNNSDSKGNSKNNSGANTSGGTASPPPPGKNNKGPSFSKEYTGGTTYNKNGVMVHYEYNGNGTGNVHIHANENKYHYDSQGFLKTGPGNSPKAPPHIQKLLHDTAVVKAIIKALRIIQGLGGHLI